MVVTCCRANCSTALRSARQVVQYGAQNHISTARSPEINVRIVVGVPSTTWSISVSSGEELGWSAAKELVLDGGDCSAAQPPNTAAVSAVLAAAALSSRRTAKGKWLLRTRVR